MVPRLQRGRIWRGFLFMGKMAVERGFCKLAGVERCMFMVRPGNP